MIAASDEAVRAWYQNLGKVFEVLFISIQHKHTLQDLWLLLGRGATLSALDFKCGSADQSVWLLWLKRFIELWTHCKKSP